MFLAKKRSVTNFIFREKLKSVYVVFLQHLPIWHALYSQVYPVTIGSFTIES